MATDRNNDRDHLNSLHAEGFDDFRAGSLAQEVIMRERRDTQDAHKRRLLEQLNARQFTETMLGGNDKPGIGLGTFITQLMTAAGQPPTPAQAKMLTALDGPQTAAAAAPKHYSYAASHVDLGSLFGADQAKNAIAMPRADFGRGTFGSGTFDSGISGLLNTIAHYETHRADRNNNDGYDRVFGKANTMPLTKMTINQVLAWQDEYVADGSKSSAAGRYQIIRGTMRGLAKDMGLTGNELFDQTMQDRMAVTLLKQAGLDKYMNGSLSADTFQNRISGTWASVQNAHGQGQYDHDGLNKAAHDSGTQVASVIRTLGAPTLALN
ncbi:MAG: hypothetical protein V4621_00835 [Pseudomonadota bacterium]